MTEWFNSRSMCTWKQASGAARSHAPLLWGATVNYAKMKQSQRITCASSVNSVMFSIYALRAFREGKTKAQRALLLPSGAGLLIRRRGIACTGAVRHDRPRRGAPHATPACTRAKAELDQNACPVQPYDSNRNITCQSTALCFCATPPPMCGSACPAGHRP